MKKLLTIAVVLALILPGVCPVLAEGENVLAPVMPLTVGVTTKMSGFFFTGKWGVNSADVDLRADPRP